MNVKPWTDKVEEIVDNNPCLSLTSENGVLIHILEQADGTIKIGIDVDEATTDPILRGAIKHAFKWRSALENPPCRFKTYFCKLFKSRHAT